MVSAKLPLTLTAASGTLGSKPPCGGAALSFWANGVPGGCSCDRCQPIYDTHSRRSAGPAAGAIYFPRADLHVHSADTGDTAPGANGREAQEVSFAKSAFSPKNTV